MNRRAIEKVSFPSRWLAMYDQERTGVAEFKLGDGPCGRTVTQIDVGWDADRLTVTQHYTDGKAKDFTYRLADITGRVEVTYGEKGPRL